MAGEQEPVIKITSADLELQGQDEGGHNQPNEPIEPRTDVDEAVAAQVVAPELTGDDKQTWAEVAKQEVDRVQQNEREGWLNDYLQEELNMTKNVVVHESPNNHLIIEITNMGYKATVPVPAEMFAALQAYQAGNTTQAPRDIIRGYASELKETMAQGLKEILSNHPDIKPTLEAPDWLDWELQKDNEEISQRKRGVIERLYRKITGQA